MYAHWHRQLAHLCKEKSIVCPSVSENRSRQDEQEPGVQQRIYFPILTGGLYIIPLIIWLLAKMIKDIPPKCCCRFVASAKNKKYFFTQIEC